MCFRPQIIKLTQRFCEDSLNDNNVLFVRSNHAVKKKKALIEVPFTHTALVIKGGGKCNVLPSGTHKVFDSLGEVRAWKNGSTVEIIYVPKETNVVINWGTPNKVEFRDSESKKVINVGARGSFEIFISDPMIFFTKIVGARKEFNLEDFTTRFRDAVVDEFASYFLATVEEKGISYDKFDANRKEISSKMGAKLTEKFSNDWGVAVKDFIILDFELSDEDRAKVESVSEGEKEKERKKKAEEKAKEIADNLERLDDKQWEREKYLKQLDLEDKKAYYDALKESGVKSSAFCPKCGHSVENNDAFCKNCGQSLGKTTISCKACGTENQGNSTFCSKCGAKL